MRNETYSLGHTNTSVTDGKSLGLLVGNDVDPEILARVELAWVREGLVADLVKGVRSIGNQLPQEDLLVRVDCVDNKRKELRDLSLELENLARHDCGCEIVRSAEV
jgi:hypothetical protein